MQREPREVWAKRVERWNDSSLTAREFASELGINPNTLENWKYKLAREQREARGARPRARQVPRRQPAAHRKRTKAEGGINFVEVVAPLSADSRIEIELKSGTRIRVPQAFDVAAVGGLVQALEAQS